jgi:TyrR family helix-turn-helix protein/PAS domain S-box-containing protein
MHLDAHASIILKNILDFSFDEIFITDANGLIIYTRESEEKLFGIPHEKIINKNVFDLEREGIFVPSVIASVLQEEREKTLVQETRNKTRLIISGYPVFNEKNTLIGAISFSRDITEVESLKRENEEVARAMKRYKDEVVALKSQTKRRLQATNSKMDKVLDIAYKVADLDITVLIDGESGVGKNYLAQEIHEISSRKSGPFIEVNCGSIAENLIESELFGYEEGAFTGARKGGKKGYFEAAAGGTLFLDEIGELSMNLQVKFLSVLQNQFFMRVGGTRKIEKKCRIICATNQNLEDLIHEKRFREDLYYRINVMKLTVPPLRERGEELVFLVNEIIDEFNAKYRLTKYFSPELIAWINKQEWPGNIRELRNFIERAMIISDTDEITIGIIELITDQKTGDHYQDMTLNAYIESVEKEFIVQMYNKYPSSIQLGKKLGISQSTANRKIQKYINDSQT